MIINVFWCKFKWDFPYNIFIEGFVYFQNPGDTVIWFMTGVLIMESIVKQYDAKLDERKRLTIRGSKFDFYHVKEFNDGTLVLKPRVLIDPEDLSENTLRMIDRSMTNLQKGNASQPIDLDKYLKISEEMDDI